MSTIGGGGDRRLGCCIGNTNRADAPGLGCGRGSIASTYSALKTNLAELMTHSEHAWPAHLGPWG